MRAASAEHEVKALVRHVISKELQLYCDKVCEAIRGTNHGATHASVLQRCMPHSARRGTAYKYLTTSVRVS